MSDPNIVSFLCEKNRHFRVLLAEDSEADAELLKRHLSKGHGDPFTVERVADRGQFESRLREGWDAIVCDYNVPGFSPMEALKLLESLYLDIPVLIVSGQIGEENAVDLLLAGAQDYVMKSNLARLGPALFRSIAQAQEKKNQEIFKKVHEQLVKDREQLLAVICHDLRNPLGSITLTAQLLGSYANGSTQVSSKLVGDNSSRIVKSCERIERMIHDILDGAMLKDGHFVIEPAQTNVADFLAEVRSAFERLAEKQGIKLVIAPLRSDLWVDFDSLRVFQVASNLVGNAIKFCPAGSTIHLSVEESAKSIRFVIHDDGPGISKSEHAQIFSKFFRGRDQKQEGSGLGLWIAREIVTGHGGEIGLESGVKQGTTFWFTLPLAPKKLSPDLVISKNQIANANVLLVDDDPDLSDAMAAALREVGLVVVLAADVDEAIALIEKKEITFQLFMVDFDLPNRNGGELIQWLRIPDNRNSEIPIVLMSAHPDVYERAQQLEVCHFLRKPMKLERLLDVVAKCL